MLNTGRDEDIKELYRTLAREQHPKVRQNIKRTIEIIRGETGAIRSMREKLIMAHRRGDTEEIKDIHEFIKNKEKYQNERYRVS